MATTAQVYQLYLAYFGRPPDFTGLNSFANSTPAQVQAIFSASAESRALLGSTDTATQVNNIYQNLFGRDAETAGLGYWVSEIASGRVTLASAAFDILNGARNADATVVANRIEVAQAFVANYSATTAGILGYVGDAAAAQARTFLRTVTDTAASKTAALAGVAAAVASTVSAGAGAQNPGGSFALATAVDNLPGTSGNDSFTANFSGDGNTSNTYNTGDAVNGGSGTDSITITATGDASGVIVSLSGIETVSIRALSDVTFNAVDWRGVSTVELADNSISSANLTVNNADVGSRYVINGSASDLSLDFVNTVATDTVKIGLDGISASTVTLRATDDLARNISIGASGTNSVTLSIATATGTAYNASVSGAGALTLTAATSVSALSLAGFSGAATVNLYSGTASVAQGAQNITGGQSGDTLSFGAVGGLTSDDTVNGGAGTDAVSAQIGTSLLNLRNVSAVETLTLGFDGSTGRVDASGSDAITTVNVRGTASNVADITFSALPAASVNLLGTAGNVTLDTSGGNLSVIAGSASAAGLSLTTLTLEAASAATITGLGTGSLTHTLGDITAASGVKSLTINTQGDADLSIGAIDAASASTITITTNGSAAVTGGADFTAVGGLTTLTVTANGEAADVTLGALGVAADSGISAGAVITLTGRDGGDITLGDVAIGTAQTNGGVSIQAGGSSNIVVGNFAGTGAAFGGLTISAGTLASVTAGTISTTGTGAGLGNVSITEAASGTVRIGQITVASAGTISATLAADARLNLAGLTATGSVSNTVGNISISGGGNATVGTISASGIGTFTYSGGSGLAVTQLDGVSASIGAISISGVAGTASIASIQASSVGAITVAGSADVSLSVTATNFTSFNAAAAAGSANTTISANFASVVSNIDITLGSASNFIVSGRGNDTITLAAGSGLDTIHYTNTAQATDSISRFLVGTGGDVIRVAGTAMEIVGGNGGGTAGFAVTATSFTELASGAMTGVSLGTASGYILVSGTSFANANEMISAIAGGGSFAISGGTASDGGFTGGSLLVVWSDGDSSYVTLVDATAVNGASFVVSNAATATDVTLAQLNGVDRSALENWIVTNVDFEAQ